MQKEGTERLTFPAVFPWRISLRCSVGCHPWKHFHEGNGSRMVGLSCSWLGLPGRGKLGVMLALALSAPFVVAQRWNPLWGLTVTLGGTHTNLPPAPGDAPWASGAGILAGQEPGSSECPEHWERGEGPREQRERSALAPRPAPPRSIQVLRISLAISPDGTTWFGATLGCVPIPGGRSDRGEGGELTPKAPPRGNRQLCVCSIPSPRCSELCRVSPGVARDTPCPPRCWQGGSDGSHPPEATRSRVAQLGDNPVLAVGGSILHSSVAAR